MPRQHATHSLIIGGGPAGIQTSRYLKSREPERKVTVIRPEDNSVIYCALPYAIEGLFPLERTLKSDALLTDVGVELVRGRVARVDPGARLVTLEDGSTVTYERLLIGTGAVPFVPPIPGADLANVYTIKTADDTRTIMERLGRPGQRAVVVGSGAIGIEQATAYRAHGIEVHLIEMRDHILPHLVDADMTGPLEDALRAQGIELHLNAGLERLEGTDEVERVVLGDGTRIELEPGRDFVMMSVGMRPDIDFLEGAGLDRAPDGLVVDASMRTSAPGIWAAGDCVSFHSGIDGRPLGGKLATNAVPMALVAARSMLGEDARYPGFFNGAATVVGEYRVAGTGFTATFAASRGLDVFCTRGESTTRFPMMPGAGKVSVKLVVERGTLRIIGAQIVGAEAVAERIDVVTLAIQHRMTAHDLAAFSYSAQPWQTFFPAKNAIVEAAQAAVRESQAAARKVA